MKPPFWSLLYVFFAAFLLVAPATALAADDDDSDAEGEEGDGGEAEEEEFVEPDAWERPPKDEEKPKKKKEEAPKEELPPGDGRHFQVGLNISWGVPVEKRNIFADDAWNFGTGLRIGYSFDPGIWGGLHYSYFLGAGETQGQLVAAEIGFDWWITPAVIVRPAADLGAGIITGPDVSGTAAKTTRGGFYFGPGLCIIVPLDMLYTGGEIRHAVITNGLQSTTIVTGYFGARF